MTEEQNRRLSALDGRINELLALCERQKTEIRELTLKREQEKSTVQQVQGELQALKAKYRDLLTAHVMSFEQGDDMKSARKRLLNLVREIDACINYITQLNG
jgi:chromosome segregation ATPase